MKTYRVELISFETGRLVCAEYVQAINEHYAVEKANNIYAPYFEVDRATVTEVLNETV